MVLPRIGIAQDQIEPNQFHYFNCFPHLTEGKSSNPALLPNSAVSPSALSTVDSRNGYLHTPKGSLKVLIIFAGFDEDNVPPPSGQTSSIPFNNNSINNSWPQTDATHPVWGTAFPRNLSANYGYTNDSQFNPANTDNSLSNFYYKMSKEQFKLTFGYFPVRVNVPYNASGHHWTSYSKAVLDKAVDIAPNYPNFSWAAFDQRTNLPNFASNNSISVPDGKIDYTIIV